MQKILAFSCKSQPESKSKVAGQSNNPNSLNLQKKGTKDDYVKRFFQRRFKI